MLCNPPLYPPAFIRTIVEIAKVVTDTVKQVAKDLKMGGWWNMIKADVAICRYLQRDLPATT